MKVPKVGDTIQFKSARELRKAYNAKTYGLGIETVMPWAGTSLTVLSVAPKSFGWSTQSAEGWHIPGTYFVIPKKAKA